MDSILKNLYNTVLNGDVSGTTDLARQALDAGLQPTVILNEGMVAAMREVGDLFEAGTYFIPDMLISATAMQNGLELLRPYLVNDNYVSRGKVVVGTVKGDLHDIGKNLVSMMLEGASYEIIDVGTDASPEKFVEAVRVHQADVVAMSAMLTTTMPNMGLTIEALKKAGVRESIKVIVGGASVTRGFADSIGADGYSADAGQAVALLNSLVSNQSENAVF